MTFKEKFGGLACRLLWAACLVLVGCTRARELANRPVVNVDGRELKAAVFADQLALKLRHLDALTAKDPDVVHHAKDDLIRDFVITVLTENWAKSNGLFVRAEDLDSEVARIRRDYPDNLTFEQMLTDQHLSMREWRDQLTKTLLFRLVNQSIMGKSPTITDEDMRSYYKSNKDKFERPEQVHLRQIVLANETDAKLMEEQLKKGKPLSELAEKHSIMAEGKRKKGDLGWIEKGVMEGFDPAFGMRIGQRSGIVKSPYGYHIFEIIGKRPAQTRSFEDAKEEIRRSILADREQAVYTSWLETQLRKARVLRDDELISKIRIETKGT